MKKINQLLAAAVLGSLAVLCLINAFLFWLQPYESGNEYRISLNRIQWDIEKFEQEKGRAAKGLEELAAFAGVKGYPFVTKLSVLEYEERRSAEESAKGESPTGEPPSLGGKTEAKQDFWKNEEGEYAVAASEYGYYKIFYISGNLSKRPLIFLVNGIAGFFILLLWLALLYVRQKILLPFSRLSDLPYELSKGNLTLPLKENKDKFFGKFMWGMDMLRENLEDNKARELELQKEKKMLLLSLSHDIKTPLSAIHLYAQALCKNLYREEAKKLEIAGNIREKAEEIESYIGEIVRASNEDFLDFQVENREIYIGDALEQIRVYYREKMAFNQVTFSLRPYPNCLVWGDLDRLVEVIQNVVENAIKYGDGRNIQIHAGREEEEYAVLVRNTGCELPQKELPHMFDSFFRGSNAGKNPGSGLGLYICRQLMHRMEGEITGAVKIEGEERWMEINIVLHLA